MTTVCMLQRQGRYVGFEAQGHTGYGEEGSDIVCSAVSALTQTILLGLTQRLGLPVDYKLSEGKLACVVREGVAEAGYRDAEILLSTMLLGLQSMREGYGEYLSITQREV